MKTSIQFSIILPTLNEETNVTLIINKIIQILDEYSRSVDYEIVVVDDNSSDNTVKEVKKLIDNYPNVCITLHERSAKPGLAYSIKDGIVIAKYDNVMLMDSDFNHDPGYIPVFLEMFSVFNQKAIVSGSRYIPGGGMSNKRFRYLGSYVFNLYIKLFLRSNLNDHLSGFTLFNKKILNAPAYDEIFYGYGDYYIRLLSYAKGLRVKIVELPINYTERFYGVSKTDFKRYFILYTKSVLKIVFNKLWNTEKAGPVIPEGAFDKFEFEYFENLCPNCKSSAIYIKYKLNKYNILECRECEARYANPHISDKGVGELYKNNKSLAEIFSFQSNYFEYDRGESEEIAKIIYTISKQFNVLDSGVSLIDVACGSGGFLNLLSVKTRLKLNGIDRLKNNQNPETGNSINLINSEFLSHDFQDNKYKIITLLDALEHFPEPERVIKKCFDIADTNALLIISSPDTDSLLNIIVDLAYKCSLGRLRKPAEIVYIFEHILFFNLKSLNALLSRPGGKFEIVDYFKINTNLSLYDFSFVTGAGLRAVFLLNKLFGKENRIVVFAKINAA